MVHFTDSPILLYIFITPQYDHPKTSKATDLSSALIACKHLGIFLWECARSPFWGALPFLESGGERSLWGSILCMLSFCCNHMEIREGDRLWRQDRLLHSQFPPMYLDNVLIYTEIKQNM